jgi:hypothetical protein
LSTTYLYHEEFLKAYILSKVIFINTLYSSKEVHLETTVGIRVSPRPSICPFHNAMASSGPSPGLLG